MTLPRALQPGEEHRTLEHEPELDVACGPGRESCRVPITAPDVGSSSPETMRSSVDLPQPDGPTMATNSPSAMVKAISSRALHRPVPVKCMPTRSSDDARGGDRSRSCDVPAASYRRMPSRATSMALSQPGGEARLVARRSRSRQARCSCSETAQTMAACRLRRWAMVKMAELSISMLSDPLCFIRFSTTSGVSA